MPSGIQSLNGLRAEVYMNKFVLAFPIPVAETEDFKISDVVSVSAEATTLLVPGCNVRFDVVRKPALPTLSEIFREHNEISAEEAATIDAHRSLLFLISTLKSADDLSMVNSAILKMFTAGAAGVYMQQSGTAWTAGAFREELGDAEFPMDPWINFVESADLLYTLGLEVFGLPDLSISHSIGSAEELKNILAVVADTIFVDGVSSKSGTEVDAGDSGVFVLRSETKSPFSKDSPEFNRQGIMRLSKK